MRKAKLLLLSGIWVAILPYLGFPIFLKNILFTLSGLGVIYLSYALYGEYVQDSGESNFENFSENSEWSN